MGCPYRSLWRVWQVEAGFGPWQFPHKPELHPAVIVLAEIPGLARHASYYLPTLGNGKADAGRVSHFRRSFHKARTAELAELTRVTALCPAVAPYLTSTVRELVNGWEGGSVPAGIVRDAWQDAGGPECSPVVVLALVLAELEAIPA